MFITKLCAALACALTLAPAASAASGWGPTGDMVSAHGAAQAALTADGRVLVAGGFGGGAEIPTADLYDPATGTWSAAAPLLVPRHYATLTPLPDGRLLLAGGYAGGGATASAELYDPVANTWTATGSMIQARTSHSATLLADGTVLVAGGDTGPSSQLDSAERYDPATGTWSPAGTMAHPRESQVQALLPDGRVLVAGGFYDTGTTTQYLAAAELYDPVANTWSPTASMATARGQMAFARLGDGTVLAAGGINTTDGRVRSAERYDPATGTWSPVGALSFDADLESAAVLPDGRVLVVSRLGSGAGQSALFDPASGTFGPARALGVVRQYPTVTALGDGSVLVAGGSVSGTQLKSAEIWRGPTTRTVANADFGALQDGESAERDVTLTNSGTLPLWVASVAVGGADAGAFTIVADGCGGRTIAAGASCTVRVRFTAAGAAGARAAQLTIDDNADGAAAPALNGTVAVQDTPPDDTPTTPQPTPPTSTTPAPVTPPAPVVTTPKPAPKPKPTAKACSSRRKFTVSKSLSRSIRSGTAKLNGKVIAHLTAKRRTITVDLRGKKAGTYTLRVTIKTKQGKTVKLTRRYKTCAPRR